MKILATVLLISIPFKFLASPVPVAESQPKTFVPKMMIQTPKIDGEVDPLWDSIDSVSDFFQLQPFFDKPPSHRTVAKVFTTADALYCLMICYDERENILGVTGTLDNTPGDICSIMLDTFGDKRTAYKLAVTASGVRADCRLLDDGRNRDYTWDGVWFAASKIYDWGFVVEWEIPYKSLQYGKELKAWGLDFDRWSPRRAEDLYWNNYAQNEGQRISKFGSLQFDNFYPSTKGLNLEIYPVGIGKTTRREDGTYKNEGSAGLDIFYNPFEQLTFQLTANPDFAQIEADPFSFNISRYETHYSERRPFFTQGNEIFIAAGKERNSGFYQPLELFYSRRIGKKLSDGSEVPLQLGTKAFGRVDDWEYGGFLAATGERTYQDNNSSRTERSAQFEALRFKRQILGNSSIGMLYVGRQSEGTSNGVIDLDGAFRSSDMQISWQAARSYRNGEGGFAGSMGLKHISDHWMNLFKVRLVQDSFDIDDVGYVPWRGTDYLLGFSGPRWYFDTGTIREFSIAAGPLLNYKTFESYTDRAAWITINMQMRANWGWEIDAGFGRSKDNGIEYPSNEIDISSWYSIAPAWNGDLYGSWSHTYNFSRNYLGDFANIGSDFQWHTSSILTMGTSASVYVEYKPTNEIEDITYDARPYLTLTPINDLSVTAYVDNLYTRNADQMQQIITGFLISYNYLPKSWIYFAINDIRDRSNQFDSAGFLLPGKMHVTAQAAVLKLKYLYYL